MKDLAEVSLELLVNSLEAHATHVSFELSLGTLNRMVLRDNGKGMDKAMLKTITSPYSTSRQTRSLGFGLAFFKQAVEQAEGSIEIHSEVGKGTTVIGQWVSSHIDALPMGNLGETIALILQRSPQCDLRFTLNQNQTTQTFNSRDVRDIIAPLTLDEPEIQRWIETSINSLFVNRKEIQ